MARPLRDTTADKVHLITTRTARAELLLVPSPELNELIGGVLAKYVEEFQVELFAYCFLSNHYHLLVRAREGILPRFVENLNREIAHRVNRLLKRETPLWGRRYDDQITLETYDAVEAAQYIATNPTKHGLVQDPKQWPGLTCYKQLITETSRDFYFTNYTEYHKAKRRALSSGKLVRLSDYQSRHTLKLSRLSYLENKSFEERSSEVEKLLLKRTRKLVRERRAQGKGFIGRKAVLQQPKMGVIPKDVSRSTRPPCYTKNPHAAKIFKEEESSRHARYAEASYRYRSGELLVEFPAHCIKPPVHHIPRKFLIPPAPD